MPNTEAGNYHHPHEYCWHYYWGGGGRSLRSRSWKIKIKQNPPCKKVKKLLQSLCFFIREDEEGGDKEWGNEKKKQTKKATWICPLVCFNAPKLPGGMNLWLSPSGLPRHSHLLSNLLKNGPERKKQKEPFRLKTFAGRKCVCLRGGKMGSKSFVSVVEKQINTIFAVSFLTLTVENVCVV